MVNWQSGGLTNDSRNKLVKGRKGPAGSIKHGTSETAQKQC
jgi:hypothetical protein